MTDAERLQRAVDLDEHDGDTRPLLRAEVLRLLAETRWLSTAYFACRRDYAAAKADRDRARRFEAAARDYAAAYRASADAGGQWTTDLVAAVDVLLGLADDPAGVGWAGLGDAELAAIKRRNGGNAHDPAVAALLGEVARLKLMVAKGVAAGPPGGSH